MPMHVDRARKNAAEECGARREVPLRQVRLLVPDTGAPGFAEMVRAQSRRVSLADAQNAEMDFIEAVQADNPLE